MGIKVLFIYPNTYGMNMVPPAIALFSALLKKDGHKVEIFDTTYYQTDYGIDSDGSQVDKLSVVPFNMEERGIRLKTTAWKDDLKKQIERYQPDLLALSTTEDMWELGVKILEEIKDYKVKNKVPTVAGGVFPTFAPEIVILIILKLSGNIFLGYLMSYDFFFINFKWIKLIIKNSSNSFEIFS